MSGGHHSSAQAFYGGNSNSSSHFSHGGHSHGCFKPSDGCHPHPCPPKRCPPKKCPVKVGPTGPTGPRGLRGPAGIDGTDAVFIPGKIGPTGPAGGDDLLIHCNTGTVSPTGGQLAIVGDCGIFTSCTGSTLTVSIGPHARLSDYIVDQNGIEGCVFLKLCDALDAAALDPRDCAVTIIVKAGKYELCDMLNNREINIIGVGLGEDAVKVQGDGVSHGNKSWTGITFTGGGSYKVEDPNGHIQLVDAFCKCKATDNFKWITNNDRLRFRQCHFFYDQLTRDKVIEIEGGLGVFDACNCKFFICRLGGQDVLSFVWANASTANTATEFINCHWEIIIDGTEDFYLIHIRNLQLIRVCYNSFIWTQAIPNTTVMFGSSEVNAQAQLQVIFCKVISPRRSHVTILANLWTGMVDEGIQLVSCHFIAARLADYSLEPPDGIMGGWLLERVSFISVLPVNVWFHTFAGNALVDMVFSYVNFTVFSANDIIRLTTSGANDTAQLGVANATFVNTNMVVNPRWLNTGLTTTDLFHANINRHGVNVENGVSNTTPFDTGP